MPAPRVPNVIDIEASGFGAGSYPIEVGVILDDGTRFCSLILPAHDWTHWDRDAESVHRIDRDQLERHGKPITDVCETLNELLTGKTLYSDGWIVDSPWLTTLFSRALRQMAFSVSPLEMILSEQQMALWHSMKSHLLSEAESQRHRASFDAWLIQETYKRTLACQTT